MAESESDHPGYPTYEFGAYTPPPPGYLPPPAYPPPPSGERGSAPRSSNARRAMLSTAIVAAVVGGGVGAGTVALIGTDNDSGSAGLAFATQAPPAAKIDGSITAAAAKIGPSVVTIKVTSGQQVATGSGVIIRSDGYILTNNHVIAAGATGTAGTAGASGTAGTAGTALNVTLADGRQAAGKVVGADPSDDLAVVNVSLTGLQAASFASSATLVVGQSVVAVGAPLGLSDTVTSGIVSNIARPVQTSDSAGNSAVFNAVQTDAAINPGNSGGPLVNLAGDVVGINAAIATDPTQGGLQVPGQTSQSGNIGIGFAIPSDEAARIAAQLISTGKASHAILGISVTDASATSSSGATVKTVAPNSPAAKAGLRVGDVVTRLDQQRIDNADALVAAVRSHAPGDNVTVTYRRGAGSSVAQVTLGSSGN